MARIVVFLLCSVFTRVSPAVAGTLKSAILKAPSSTSRKGLVPVPLLFPTDEDQPLNPNKISDDVPEPSPCPDDALFCESADDYPTDIIKRKLEKQPKQLLNFFYEEEIRSDDNGNKFGDFGTELCLTEVAILYPKKARSKEGNLEFIVNHDQYKQGLRVEYCRPDKNGSSKNQCPGLPANMMPNGYTTSCQQKFVVRTLMVLNRNSSNSDVDGFVSMPFDFPSCCSCLLTMDGH